MGVLAGVVSRTTGLLSSEGRATVIPRRWAAYYLGNAPSLVWLIFANVAALYVGIHFYRSSLPAVPTVLWPLYMDSPTAVLLMALALATLLPFLGRSLDAVPRTRVLAYLHTLAFVWLVKMGLWTALALNLQVGAYYPDAWNYFGILATHLLFLPEAYLLPHVARTTRGALATALVLVLANDLLDYGPLLVGGSGFYPPLRYDPGPVLVAGTVLISLLSVVLAARAFER